MELAIEVIANHNIGRPLEGLVALHTHPRFQSHLPHQALNPLVIGPMTLIG